MEILWKGKVSTESRTIRPKLYGDCTFPQNFHTMKLEEITVFYEAFYIHVNFLQFLKCITFSVLYLRT